MVFVVAETFQRNASRAETRGFGAENEVHQNEKVWCPCRRFTMQRAVLQTACLVLSLAIAYLSARSPEPPNLEQSHHCLTRQTCKATSTKLLCSFLSHQVPTSSVPSAFTKVVAHVGCWSISTPSDLAHHEKPSCAPLLD